MKSHRLLYVVAVALLLSCKPTVPAGILQPDEMEDVLYDYHIAEAMAKNEYGSDVDMKRNAYFQSVLKKHQISEADFDSSLVYYYSRLDKLIDIYNHVNERLGNEASRVGAAVGEISHYSQYGSSGDTANIWSTPTDLMLIPYAPDNRFSFVLKADTTFRMGDSFMFQFVTETIWQAGSHSAVVCLTARYDNDSITQHYSTVSTSGITQIRVPSNKKSMLKDLRGFIYLANDASSDVRRLMFVSQIQLIRFRDKEIEKPISNEKADSVKTDSVQRTVNARGGVVDSTSRPVGRGLRSKSAPFRKGGAKN